MAHERFVNCRIHLETKEKMRELLALLEKKNTGPRRVMFYEAIHSAVAEAVDKRKPRRRKRK